MDVSNRERVIDMIDHMDEKQIILVINLLESINALTNRSDEYDLELVEEGKIDNEQEYTSEEVHRILGF